MADKHHYVPRFYLEGFVDPARSSFLWVSDIERMTVRKESPKKAARISGYYDLHGQEFPNKSILENSLSVFEARATRIIRQLRNRHFQLPIEDRYHLANFIGLQLGRVPIFHQHLDNNYEEGANDWLKKYVTRSVKFQGKLDEEAEAFKNYVLSGKLRIKPQFTDENHRKNFLIVAAIKSGFDYAGVIFGMHWMFLLTKGKRASFFTSDNPARLMSPGAKPLEINFKGRNEYLEISFPISPSCTLWMHARDERPDIISIDVGEVGADAVDVLNQNILPTIQKYAYCSTERQAEWVLSQIQCLK